MRWRRAIEAGLPLSRLEVAVALGAALVLTAIVYGSHVFDGNFYSDDWANSSVYLHADDPKLWHSFNRFWDNLGGRPLLALFLAIPHAVFGTNPEPHLALGLVLAALACGCFYLLLRELGLAQLHAGLIATLALLFPWTDSTRLWATASINNLAVIFYLLGTLVALRGLRRDPRPVTPRQIGAVALVALSALTYEAAGVAALLSVLLYRCVTSWRVAVRRWVLDLVVVGSVLLWSAVRTQDVRGVGGVRTSLGHLPEYTRDSLSILELSFRPFSAPWWLLVAAVVVVAVLIATRGRQALRGAREARWWALVAVAAAFAVGVAYASFIGYELFPKRGGIYNRGNLLAAFPWALLVYAIAMAVGYALFAGRSPRRAWPLAAGAALALVIGLGYLNRVLDDKAQWHEAATMESRAIATLKSAVPALPPGTTVYTFDYPAQVSPGIPIFSDTWDLRGAVRIKWKDVSLAAYPIFDGAQFVCGRDRLYPTGGKEFYFLEEGYGPGQGADYGKALAVDLRTGDVRRIENARDCTTVLPAMTAGPHYVTAAR